MFGAAVVLWPVYFAAITVFIGAAATTAVVAKMGAGTGVGLVVAADQVIEKLQAKQKKNLIWVTEAITEKPLQNKEKSKIKETLTTALQTCSAEQLEKIYIRLLRQDIKKSKIFKRIVIKAFRNMPGSSEAPHPALIGFEIRVAAIQQKTKIKNKKLKWLAVCLGITEKKNLVNHIVGELQTKTFDELKAVYIGLLGTEPRKAKLFVEMIKGFVYANKITAVGISTFLKSEETALLPKEDPKVDTTAKIVVAHLVKHQETKNLLQIIPLIASHCLGGQKEYGDDKALQTKTRKELQHILQQQLNSLIATGKGVELLFGLYEYLSNPARESLNGLAAPLVTLVLKMAKKNGRDWAASDLLSQFANAFEKKITTALVQQIKRVAGSFFYSQPPVISGNLEQKPIDELNRLLASLKETQQKEAKLVEVIELYRRLSPKALSPSEQQKLVAEHINQSEHDLSQKILKLQQSLQVAEVCEIMRILGTNFSGNSAIQSYLSRNTPSKPYDAKNMLGELLDTIARELRLDKANLLQALNNIATGLQAEPDTLRVMLLSTLFSFSDKTQTSLEGFTAQMLDLLQGLKFARPKLINFIKVLVGELPHKPEDYDENDLGSKRSKELEALLLSIIEDNAIDVTNITGLNTNEKLLLQAFTTNNAGKDNKKPLSQAEVALESAKPKLIKFIEALVKQFPNKPKDYDGRALHKKSIQELRDLLLEIIVIDTIDLAKIKLDANDKLLLQALVINNPEGKAEQVILQALGLSKEAFAPVADRMQSLRENNDLKSLLAIMAKREQVEGKELHGALMKVYTGLPANTGNEVSFAVTAEVFRQHIYSMVSESKVSPLTKVGVSMFETDVDNVVKPQLIMMIKVIAERYPAAQQMAGYLPPNEENSSAKEKQPSSSTVILPVFAGKSIANLQGILKKQLLFVAEQANAVETLRAIFEQCSSAQARAAFVEVVENAAISSGQLRKIVAGLKVKWTPNNRVAAELKLDSETELDTTTASSMVDESFSDTSVSSTTEEESEHRRAEQTATTVFK